MPRPISEADWYGPNQGPGAAPKRSLKSQMTGQEDEPGFLAGLMHAITSGAQGTMDAFNQDVDSLRDHRLPSQAIKAGGQILSQMGSPSVNPVIPALKYTRMSENMEPVFSKTYAGGDALQTAIRNGGLGSYLQTLMQGMEKARP